MATKTLLNPPGIQSLRHFLTNELPRLQQAPILLIASEPAANDGVSHSQIRDASRLVHFTLSQQFGLRIVPANISSGFPTLSDVESRRDLLRRTGASSIVAVGSGAAMDLAKALARNDNDNHNHNHNQQKHDTEHLILVPSTYSAFVASGTSHSLLLDQVEETLVPYPSTDDRPSCTTTIAPLERKYIATMESSLHALYAVTAVVLDAYLRKIDDPQLDSMIQSLHMLYALSDDQLSHGQLAHDTLLDLCFRAGNLLSYGLGKDDRSTPLALSSSLIPPLFPHIPMLTFWATLLPGLCHVLSSPRKQGNHNVPTLVQEIISRYTNHLTDSTFPKLTITDESKQGFSIPDMAISHIQTNGTVSKSFDMPQQLLTDILKHAIPK